MILYHGTLLEYAESIRDTTIDPKININNELDFGYGFYLGDEDYAKGIAKSKQKTTPNSTAVLMEFDVDFDAMKNAFSERLIHETKTKDYLDDVFECRYHQGEEYLNVPFVEAPIADGFVDIMMQWYKKREDRLRKAIVYFMYWIPTKHRQLVVKDMKVCEYVKLVRILDMKGGVLWEKN